MIEVNIRRAPDGLVEHFEASGHAGYDESGKDIVCAAATAVMFTAVGYAESLYNPKGDKKLQRFKEADGHLEWDVPEIDAETRQKLIPVFDAMVLGLQQIRLSAGKRYLVVFD